MIIKSKYYNNKLCGYLKILRFNKKKKVVFDKKIKNTKVKHQLKKKTKKI